MARARRLANRELPDRDDNFPGHPRDFQERRHRPGWAHAAEFGGRGIQSWGAWLGQRVISAGGAGRPRGGGRRAKGQPVASGDLPQELILPGLPHARARDLSSSHPGPLARRAVTGDLDGDGLDDLVVSDPRTPGRPLWLYDNRGNLPGTRVAPQVGRDGD
ncbi:MAG TPA: hypothetical protein EYG54_08795 [Myxococcales bacterium]|nr:hypothetical protein [Myxococcales bacterium]